MGERTLLHAEREDFHLVFGSDRGFSRRSVGYLGASDGWQDLHKGNFQMDWQYRQAGPGSLVLTGEVDLAGTGDAAISTPLVDGGNGAEFVLGVAFGDSSVSAAAKLVQSFATPLRNTAPSTSRSGSARRQQQRTNRTSPNTPATGARSTA